MKFFAMAAAGVAATGALLATPSAGVGMSLPAHATHHSTPSTAGAPATAAPAARNGHDTADPIDASRRATGTGAVAGPPGPSVRGAHRPQTVAATVDGVALTISASHLPDAPTDVSEPGLPLQEVALHAVRPYYALTVTAVPYGKADSWDFPDDGAARPGVAAAWSAALRSDRDQEQGDSHRGPSARLFGKDVTGIASTPDVPLDGIHYEKLQMIEWVAEAGDRVFLVQLSQERQHPVTGFGAGLTLSATGSDAPTSIGRVEPAGEKRAHADPSGVRTPAAGSAPGGRASHSAAPLDSTLPAPSWWKGTTCDTAQNPRSHPLTSETVRGVLACGPLPETSGDSGTWGGISEWQCTELVERYMYLAGYISAQYRANGGEIVANYPGSLLQKQSSGAGPTSPAVGDVVSMGTTHVEGHTALVLANHVDSSGTGDITVLQQNFSSNGIGTMKVVKGVLKSEENGYSASWLHHPAGGTSPSPSLTVHGVSNGQALTGPITLSTSIDNNAGDGKQNLTHEHYFIDGTLVAGTDGAGEGSLGGPPPGSTAPGYAWTLDPVKHTGSSSEAASWAIPANLLAPGVTHRIWADGTNSAGATGTSAQISFTVTGGPKPSVLTYTGVKTADYHDAFTASAGLTSDGKPVAGATVSFTLGDGGPGQTCSAATGADGSANCGLSPDQAAGSTTLTVAYAGDDRTLPSRTSTAFVITREETTLAYTGPGHLADGVAVTLSGVLKEDGATAVAGRSVRLALGTGASQQTCTGATGADGTVSCTIPLVNQPLNDTATVPVTLTFAGDGYYLPSEAPAVLRLEYFTGRSFGLSADVNLPLVSLMLPPTPDTGQIRTAQAATTHTPCTADVSTLLVSVHALCQNVTVAAGASTSTATVSDASIGIPGLPVIGVSGLTATSTSSCTGAQGSTALTLTIAGLPVTVPTAPDSVIGLPGGARLVVNEQTSVPGADHGATVNAVHLVVPGLLGGADTADVVIGSATSSAHNCT